MERRTPLTPSHVKNLIEKFGVEVTVQSSDKRIFSDKEFARSGAHIAEYLHGCDIIFGVKEIPISAFEPGKTYIFFSHVIKGQEYNMPMLKRMMELGCNLIDYECITDDQDRRLIFFGKYAGLAGMINSFWSLGQRLKVFGITNNPFLPIRQAHLYDSLNEAKAEISEVGQIISRTGLPKELLPLTIGFTGYGNVSAGAQEIAGLLPTIEITPKQLLKLKTNAMTPENIIYKIVFREEHLVRKKATENGCACGCGDEYCLPAGFKETFDLQDYYQNPDNYQNDFEQYLPHLSVLMNCMYWDYHFPRLLTKEFARKLFMNDRPKLTVIGDITCDPNGSIEITHKGTEIEDPVFVYNPDTEQATMGFEGNGILIMAVDILPSELPRDASIVFANALFPFVKDIANTDFSRNYNDLQLPPPIKKALILHKGKLTPKFEYISGYL
jgi:alanine dehydrogenase